ncbi:MAG TPA: DUF4342 domain-containing protein, partial [Candidatus Wirthbacteria bacterium]|nr:DUF4342 domain-containing protein [Candidatus Wirthbacteria bacterium]
MTETTKKPAAKKSPTTKTAKPKADQKPEQKEPVEEIKVAGGQLVDKVKELIKEGNVRRVMIKKDDRVLLEIPLTLVVVGVAFLPVAAALGALAAVVTECTI